MIWNPHPSYGSRKLRLRNRRHGTQRQPVVGDCAGGEGDSQTGFAAGWNPELAAELAPLWVQRGLLSGSLIDVEDLVGAVDAILRAGPSASLPSVTVTPRPHKAPSSASA